HMESAAHQLATDRPAEEPAGAREHRDRSGADHRHRLVRRDDGWGPYGAPDVDGKLLVNGGYTSQVIDTNRRAVGRRDGGVKVPKDSDEPRVVCAARNSADQTRRVAPTELRGFDEGIDDFLEGARAFVPGAKQDAAIEVDR